MNPFAALSTQPREFVAHVPKKREVRPVNGLAPYERRFMEAVIEYGCLHAAADHLGIKARTAEEYMVDIRRKMKASTTILAVLQWDRKQRARAKDVDRRSRALPAD